MQIALFNYWLGMDGELRGQSACLYLLAGLCRFTRNPRHPISTRQLNPRNIASRDTAVSAFVLRDAKQINIIEGPGFAELYLCPLD